MNNFLRLTLTICCVSQQVYFSEYKTFTTLKAAMFGLGVTVSPYLQIENQSIQQHFLAMNY